MKQNNLLKNNLKIVKFAWSYKNCSVEDLRVVQILFPFKLRNIASLNTWTIKATFIKLTWSETSIVDWHYYFEFHLPRTEQSKTVKLEKNVKTTEHFINTTNYFVLRQRCTIND